MSKKLTDQQKADTKLIKAHFTSLDRIAKVMTKTTTDFSALVTNSVELLWGVGNGQIALINKTMDTLQHMKGADMRALVTFYKQCVPHTFDGEALRFTKKNKQTEAKMSETWEDFILTNEWHDFSMVKEAKPYVLNIDNLLSLVEKRLEKGNEEGGQVNDEKLEQLATGMNELITKFASVSGDSVEVDVDEIMENDAEPLTATDLDVELKAELLKQA